MLGVDEVRFEGLQVWTKPGLKGIGLDKVGFDGIEV